VILPKLGYISTDYGANDFFCDDGHEGDTIPRPRHATSAKLTKVILGAFVMSALVSALLTGCAVPSTSPPSPRYTQLKQELESDLLILKTLERDLQQKETDLKNLSDAIDELKGQLRTIEAHYPSRTLPGAVYDQYQTILGETNRLVDIFNDEIGHKYNPMYDDYSNRTDQYNAKLDEMNKIAPVTTTTYFLLLPRRFR
jgi:hypothetical protein